MRGPGAVVVEGGTIAAILDTPPPASVDHVALDSGVLTPGLIDLQINGCFGADFAAADDADWDKVVHELPRFGVTAIQPTIITNPIPALVESIEHAGRNRVRLASTPGTRLLGLHLEGPFISPERAGAHKVGFMLHPTPDHLEALLRGEAAREHVTMVTLAPELPSGIDAVRTMASWGIVVSIGHSDATGDVVHEAVRAGARMVTHIFNAQRPLGHREPGVPGQSLAEAELSIGLIADFHHVSAPICSVVMQAAGERVVLVTDALGATGMPPGTYALGGDHIVVAADDVVARRTDGTISGAITFLDHSVRNLVSAGHDEAAVFTAATRRPADVMGRSDLGRIEAGAAADLVWWSDDYQPLRTWIGGESVYSA